MHTFAVVERWFRARALAVGALGLLAACGIKPPDDTNPDETPAPPSATDCASFTPCGGSLVGRWWMRSSCVGAVPNDPACDGYVSNQATSGTATYDFGNDGILRYGGAVSVEYDISVTPDCALAVARKDLAGYCKLVQDSSDDNPRIPAEISCSVSEALCSCHVEQGPIAGGADSSYAVSGNSVTILADGSAITLGYCVREGTLTLGSLAGQPASVFSRD